MATEHAQILIRNVTHYSKTCVMQGHTGEMFYCWRGDPFVSCLVIGETVDVQFELRPDRRDPRRMEKWILSATPTVSASPRTPMEAPQQQQAAAPRPSSPAVAAAPRYGGADVSAMLLSYAKDLVVAGRYATLSVAAEEVAAAYQTIRSSLLEQQETP